MIGKSLLSRLGGVGRSAHVASSAADSGLAAANAAARTARAAVTDWETARAAGHNPFRPKPPIPQGPIGSTGPGRNPFAPRSTMPSRSAPRRPNPVMSTFPGSRSRPTSVWRKGSQGTVQKARSSRPVAAGRRLGRNTMTNVRGARSGYQMAKRGVNRALPMGTTRRKVALGQRGTFGRAARMGAYGAGGAALASNAVLGPRPRNSATTGLQGHSSGGMYY